MNDVDQARDKVLNCAARIAGWSHGDASAELAIGVMASPSWRGVDGAPWRVRSQCGKQSLFVKRMDDDASHYINIEVAFDAAKRASDLGIGPKVYLSDVQEGLLVMEDLDQGWRVAGNESFSDPKIVDQVIAAQRKFQNGAPLMTTGSVFSDIDLYYSKCKAISATLPPDVNFLVDEMHLAAEFIEAGKVVRVPIHGDAIASNIMISESGEVRLIDWDRATTGDPMEDIGSFLVEAFDHEPEAYAAFVRNFPHLDDTEFYRARLLGYADDLRWGLLGAYLSAISRRKTLEFYKYAGWRLLRCRLALRSPRFGDMIRRTA